VRPDEVHALAFSPIEKMSDVLIIPSIMLRRGQKWNGSYKFIVRLSATANKKERSCPRSLIVEFFGVRAEVPKVHRQPGAGGDIAKHKQAPPTEYQQTAFDLNARIHRQATNDMTRAQGAGRSFAMFRSAVSEMLKPVAGIFKNRFWPTPTADPLERRASELACAVTHSLQIALQSQTRVISDYLMHAPNNPKRYRSA
jgi:hypothetical protein